MYVIINLEINNFRILNNNNPNVLAIFFSNINPDAHVSTKINTFTFYKGVKEAKYFFFKKLKVNGGFFSFSSDYLDR